MVRTTLENELIGLEFTTRQFWGDHLSDAQRERLIEAYGDKTAAFRGINQCLATEARKGTSLKMVKRHSGGLTRWVYAPQPRTRATQATDGKHTYTYVGKTTDGTDLYRNDATGIIGMLRFEEL